MAVYCLPACSFLHAKWHPFSLILFETQRVYVKLRSTKAGWKFKLNKLTTWGQNMYIYICICILVRYRVPLKNTIGILISSSFTLKNTIFFKTVNWQKTETLSELEVNFEEAYFYYKWARSAGVLYRSCNLLLCFADKQIRSRGTDLLIQPSS